VLGEEEEWTAPSPAAGVRFQGAVFGVEEKRKGKREYARLLLRVGSLVVLAKN